MIACNCGMSSTCLPTNKQKFATATTIAVVATTAIIWAFWPYSKHSKVFFGKLLLCYYLSWNHSSVIMVCNVLMPCLLHFWAKATAFWKTFLPRVTCATLSGWCHDLNHFKPAALPPGSSGFQQLVAICWVSIIFWSVPYSGIGKGTATATATTI